MPPFTYLIMSWEPKNIIDESDINKILEKVSEYDLYSHYMGEPIPIGKPISSPFREDKHPSFCFFIGKKDKKLMWKDFATGESGDIVQFVKNIFQDTNGNAIKRIIKDIEDGKVNSTEEGKSFKKSFNKIKTIITVKRKNFIEEDDIYWKQFNINRDVLKEFEVFPISNFWVNDEYQPYTYTKNNPIYAYKVYDKFKIYRPLSPNIKNKWRSNLGQYDIQGWKQLPEKEKIIIITKSLKDVMVLYSFGYNAIAVNSENVYLPEKAVKELRERFKEILLFYDNDESGRLGSDKMSKKYNLKQIFIPSSYNTLFKAKDISDFYKEFGKNKTKELLKELI
jgi:DNA primase